MTPNVTFQPMHLASSSECTLIDPLIVSLGCKKIYKNMSLDWMCDKEDDNAQYAVNVGQSLDGTLTIIVLLGANERFLSVSHCRSLLRLPRRRLVVPPKYLNQLSAALRYPLCAALCDCCRGLGYSFLQGFARSAKLSGIGVLPKNQLILNWTMGYCFLINLSWYAFNPVLFFKYFKEEWKSIQVKTNYDRSEL